MHALFVTIRKWFLLIILLLSLFFFFEYRIYDYLNFETLKIYQSKLQRLTDAHYGSSIALYILLFTFLIACAIPCATFLTLVGGFLFGTIAVIYAMFATTLGGVILYLAVRSAIGNDIKARSSGLIKKMETGFQQNAFRYLLTLRLIPIFPCWFSNVSAGALNIPLKTFVSATIIGIAPSTLIYILVGRGLDKFFKVDASPDINIIFTPTLLFPLLALATLTLLPLILKFIRQGNKL